MMKKMLLLSVLAVMISGCMVSPYDDDQHRHSDRDGRYDRQHGDRDWNNNQRPHWNDRNADRHDRR